MLLVGFEIAPVSVPVGVSHFPVARDHVILELSSVLLIHRVEM